MNLQITKFFHVFALTLSTLDVDIFNLLHKLNITKVSHIRPIQSNFTSLYYVCRFNMLLGLWGSFHEQCVGFINMKVTISLLSLQLNIILILNTRYIHNLKKIKSSWERLLLNSRGMYQLGGYHKFILIMIIKLNMPSFLS